MRIIVAPFGSRGDFQPLLALSVALQRAGHDVKLLTTQNFGAEAAAFGVAADASALDVEAYVREATSSGGTLRALLGLARPKNFRAIFSQMVETALRASEGADLIIGGGGQFVAPTVAEKLRVPYLHAAYSPQHLPSRCHPPIILPVFGLPRWGNRFVWWLYERTIRLLAGGLLNGTRRQLGLAPVRNFLEYLSPPAGSVVAADPELAVVPEDISLVHPLTGALFLPDERPLPPRLEAFLEAGEPPVYVGFGSMGDRHPERTSRAVIEAVRAAGRRLVLSSGWAGFGGAAERGEPLGDDVLVVGPVSHWLLFPRVAAIVHHGGAGTTQAALRAGRPQLVVPHLFDQFQWGRWVARAGVGPQPLPKRRLTADRLRAKLDELLREPHHASRAEEISLRVRARDPFGQWVAIAENAVGAARREAANRGSTHP
jgi:vancomycin aglycone glucosyltransferase